MAKINDDAVKASREAPMGEKSSGGTKRVTLYDVPDEWQINVKKMGVTFNAYAKMAIVEKLKRDGLI